LYTHATHRQIDNRQTGTHRYIDNRSKRNWRSKNKKKSRYIRKCIVLELSAF